MGKLGLKHGENSKKMADYIIYEEASLSETSFYTRNSSFSNKS